MKSFESTALRFDGKSVWALDQRQLPHAETWIDISEPEMAIEAIRTLAIRGAPLIGVASAICLGRYFKTGVSRDTFKDAAERIREARPTAVNLSWAVDRMLRILDEGGDVSGEGEAILHEDQGLCDKIAIAGSELIKDGMNLLTHCNAGELATSGVGTALGIITRAHQQGKKIHVYVDETRPLLQGGRLTAWELKRAEVPYTVICDNMAASLMRSEKIQMAIVGADRIATNGDFANKIGTYSVAVNCNYHEIPLIVAAPFSTVDRDCPTGLRIPIEERDPSEVLAGEHCFNPAFDVTPAELVHRYVLDTGVFTVDTFRKSLLRDA